MPRSGAVLACLRGWSGSSFRGNPGDGGALGVPAMPSWQREGALRRRTLKLWAAVCCVARPPRGRFSRRCCLFAAGGSASAGPSAQLRRGANNQTK